VKKPASLRAALQDALPEFRREPGRLKVWIEDGSGLSRQTGTLAFAFRYRLHLLMEEVASDIALVALPIFRWLRVNQPELLAPGAAGFAFDADVLDNGSADILIQLDLTENVTVAPREEGGWALDYLPEPDPLFTDGEPLDGIATFPDLTEVVTTTDTP